MMATTSFAFLGLFPIIGLFFGGGSIPLSIPPLPEDAVMSRVAPPECLAYMSWAGMAAPIKQSPNQTEQLLAEGEVQSLLTAIDKAILSGINAGASHGAGDARIVADLYPWAKLLLMRPAALFVSKVVPGAQGVEVQGGAVFNLETKAADAAAVITRYEAMLPPDAVQKVDLAGVACHRIKLGNAPAITWGLQKRYLVVGIGEGSLEGIVDRVRKQPPEWLAKLRKQMPVERLATLTYINVKQIVAQFAPMGGPKVKLVLDALGLSNVTSLTSLTGLNDKGCVSRTLVGIDGPATGILTLADAKPLTADDLAPIPADATLAFAGRIDMNAATELALKQIEMADPRAKQEALRNLGQMETELGFKLQDDLLKPLGDVACAYNSPGEGGFLVTGFTAVMQVKDRARLAATLDKLVARFQKEADRADEPPKLSGLDAPAPMPRRTPQIRKFTFAGHDVLYFDSESHDFPMAPAWCLTEKALIVSTFPQHIKSYLARGIGYRSLATVPDVAGALHDGHPVSLSYCDTRKVAETVYPLACFAGRMMGAELSRQGIAFDASAVPSASAILPHLRPSIGIVRRTASGIEVVNHGTLPTISVGPLLPLWFGVSIPAVAQVRTSAKHTQSMNNLKQIALCAFNYEATYQTFPPAFTSDKKTGKPLLSWRVAMLPYMEEVPLYNEFHLDEPWDSDHNKPLIAKMPKILRSPGSTVAPGMTNYLTIRHKDSAFPGKEGIKITAITDGTSNTLMAVEVDDDHAVTWTKPDDLDFDPQKPLAGLKGLWPNGFIAAFCDGSVRFIPATVAPETMRRLVYRNDGNPVQAP